MMVDGCAAAGTADSEIEIVTTKIVKSAEETIERQVLIGKGMQRSFSAVPVISSRRPP
jgi:hypothetical protein